jgi:hypothetical protein
VDAAPATPGRAGELEEVPGQPGQALALLADQPELRGRPLGLRERPLEPVHRHLDGGEGRADLLGRGSGHDAHGVRAGTRPGGSTFTTKRLPP